MKRFDVHKWNRDNKIALSENKSSPFVINKLTTIYHKIKGWLAGGKVDLNDPLSQQLGLGVDINEQGFDDRLAKQMGMSNDEFEDQVTSRDIGEPFPGDDELTIGYSKAKDLIEKLRQDYRNMSDDELDEFSVEMVEHFLDNLSAQVRAKTILTKRGI